MEKTILAVTIITLLISGCIRDEPIVGGNCGTVSPDSRDACCERQNKDKPHIQCVGSWTYGPDKAQCEYVCDSSQVVDVETNANKFCDDKDAGEVYVCGEYTRVVSMVPGAGSKYYKSDGTEIQCPVVAPDAMTDECKRLLSETDCEKACNSKESPIGGETDEHGCMLMAGYTWCEPKQKCLRTWEEDCPGDEPEPEYDRPGEGTAVDIAEEYVKNMSEYGSENGRNLKIKKILQARCIGCWDIELQYDLDLGKPSSDYTNDRITAKITLNNWEVANAVMHRGGITILVPEECESRDGRVVNTLGENCSVNEQNIGEVEGLLCPCICCGTSDHA